MDSLCSLQYVNASQIVSSDIGGRLGASKLCISLKMPRNLLKNLLNKILTYRLILVKFNVVSTDKSSGLSPFSTVSVRNCAKIQERKRAKILVVFGFANLKIWWPQIRRIPRVVLSNSVSKIRIFFSFVKSSFS